MLCTQLCWGIALYIRRLFLGFSCAAPSDSVTFLLLKDTRKSKPWVAALAFSPCYRMLFSFWLWSRGLGRAAIALLMFFHSLALLVPTSSRSERLPCDRLVCSMQSGWEWLKVYKYWDLKALLSQAAKTYERLSSIPGRLHVWLTGSVVKMCTDTGYWITAYWFSTVSRNELWSVSFCFPFFIESEKCLRKNWTNYILGKYLFYHTRELLYSRALCKKLSVSQCWEN